MTVPAKIASQLLKRIANHYLQSHDFNGIPLDTLLENEAPETIETLKAVIRRGDAEVISAEWDNPFIKRWFSRSFELQVEALETEAVSLICVYPTTRYMRRTLPGNLYRAKPFTRALALAHPQLEPMCFDLGVLERYQSDPRYIFQFDGLHGKISVTNKAYKSRQMGQADHAILQSFGLGSDARGRRVAVAFLRYLSDLSSKHQQHWNSHRLFAKCRIEANYYRRSLVGEFTSGVSVYDAQLAELSHINRMCSPIGLPILFRRAFSGRSANGSDEDQSNDPPKGFGLLLKPTRRAFLDFAHVLDKVVGENLNREFFEAEGIPLEEEIKRKDGRHSIIQRGTLTLLEDWLGKRIHFRVDKGPTRIVEPLKRIRKLRQEPAHRFVDDEFSLQYQSKKEALIEDVYISISNIRMLFQSHALARNYNVPEHINANNIVLY